MSSPPPAAPFASTTELPALPAGWRPLHYAVLADGALAVLVTNGGLFDEPRPMRDGRILMLGPAGWIDGPTFPLETPYPLFDRFSDGRWLVAPSRTDSKPRTWVLGPDGAVLRNIRLGDGIEHVAIDDADRIWVGWFDEGVFGNDGWRVPDLPWSPASYGVGCFTADGALVRLRDRPDASEIADCYALCVAGSGAWTCTYGGFPLVRQAPDKPTRWWRNDLPGPRAIAVEGPRVLLAGGYQDQANRLALIELTGSGTGEFVDIVATWSLPLHPTDHPNAVWRRPTMLTGRGDTLHLVDDDVWYRWRVSDLPG